MRKLLPLCLLLCLGTLHIKAQSSQQAPAEDTVKPYLKYPVLPAFNIRLLDSVTIFNTFNIPKGKPTAIIFFDPDCKHCKHMMKDLAAGMDSVKDVQFYMISPSHNMELLRNFYKDYHVADYENIKAFGRDYEFFFLSYYKTRAFPAMVLYDKNKKLLKLTEGDFTVSDIYRYTH